MKKEDIVNKRVETIEKCVKRVREVYDDDLMNLIDLTKQDSIILNIQRVCETSLFLASYIVKEKLSEQPQSGYESFEILEKNEIIPLALATNLKTIIKGFEHIALYDYESINFDILRSIVLSYLDNFMTFTKFVMENEQKWAVSQE